MMTSHGLKFTEADTRRDSLLTKQCISMHLVILVDTFQFWYVSPGRMLNKNCEKTDHAF